MAAGDNAITGYRYALVNELGLADGKTVRYNSLTGRFDPVDLAGGGEGGASPDAPWDLMPMPLSRIFPFSGWTQFEGLPLATVGYGLFNQTVAFGAAPVEGANYTGANPGGEYDVGPAPLFLPRNDLPLRIRFIGMVIPFEAVPSERTWEVAVTGYVYNTATNEVNPELLAVLPALDEPIFVTPPSPGEFGELISSLTRDVEFEYELGADEIVMGVQLQLREAVTEEVPLPEDNIGWSIAQFSVYQANEASSPRVNVDDANTWGLTQFVSATGLRVFGLNSGWGSSFGGNSITWSKLQATAEGGIEVAASAGLTALLQEPEGDPVFVTLVADRLRVVEVPSSPDDVVRKSDLDAALEADGLHVIPNTLVQTWNAPVAGTIYLDARAMEHGIAPSIGADVVVQFTGLNNYQAVQTSIRVYNAYTGPGDEYGTVTFIDQTGDRFNGDGSPGAIPTGRARQFPLSVWRDGAGDYHCRVGWGITLSSDDD